MQLAERGRLDLDAPVQKYVPAFPEKPWPVTARMLLSHLGGIRHYHPGEMDSTRHYGDINTALSIFRNDELLAEPGTRYAYTTYGYVLLGAAIEGAASARYVDYMRDNVFAPADMVTIQPDNVFAIIPNRASGYGLTSSGVLRNAGLADTSNKIPGGGYCSTAADLVKFAVALQAGRLVRPGTLKQMWTPARMRDGVSISYGLGWSVTMADGVVVSAAHGGGQQGVSTFLLIRPERRTSVAVMMNLENVKHISELAAGIAAVLEK
jgi:CubicO group peptidase (beta-lactamase class C family)